MYLQNFRIVFVFCAPLRLKYMSLSPLVTSVTDP